MNTVALEHATVARVRGSRFTGTRTFIRRLLRTRLVGPSLVVILILVLCAAFPRQLSLFDPIADQFYAQANQGPTLSHPLGTDYLGRDILSRIVAGARISMLVGIISVSIGLFVGVGFGVLGGYVGGWADTIIMRLADVIWAFPALILALAITSALGNGIGNAMIAIGVLNIPFFARLARASTLAAREMDYVLAARTLGGSSPRIMLQHVLPNIAAPVIVQASLAFGVAVTTEASLSFLGVGAQPPTPSWGVDLQVGYQYLANNAVQALVPGTVIVVSVLAFNFLGDGLRTALDPKLWQRQQ
ncbi:MAG: ABC transporter permease [Chloroflexota bacterium]